MMKVLRQLHLLLGCLFAPMILYFTLSGLWQVFRFNDLPRIDEKNPPVAQLIESLPTPQQKSPIRSLLLELSKPHTNATLPWRNPRANHSLFFQWLTIVMGFGLIMTTLIGIVLAFRFSRSPNQVLLALLAGMILPIGALFLVN